jgi:hypothetical protein
VRLGAGDRHQRLDVAGFQLGHRRAAGKTGIGQHRRRQADGVFHGQDGRRRSAGRSAGGDVGGQDQLAALGTDKRLGVVGLAVYMDFDLRITPARRRSCRAPGKETAALRIAEGQRVADAGEVECAAAVVADVDTSSGAEEAADDPRQASRKYQRAALHLGFVRKLR